MTKSFMNFKKIGTKTSLAITLMIIISSLVLIFMNVRGTSQILESYALEQLEVLSESKSNEFDILLQSTESSLKSLKFLINATFDINKFKSDPDYVASYDEMLSNAIKQNIKNNDDIGMYVVFNPDLIGFAHDVNYSFNDGSLERAPMFKMEDFELDSGMTDWYHAAKEAKKPIWLKPYFWPPNTELISYEIPIFEDNELVAVIGTSFDFNIFRNKIINMKVYENGYAFLLDENYDVLVHPIFPMGENLSEVANGEIKFITDVMSEKDTDTIEYKYDGQDKILSFTRVANGYIMALTFTKEEIFREINN